MGKKVLLGMSGGVDSSVAAILLKEQGYDVYGITMKLWESKKEIECNIDTTNEAKAICNKLDIPYSTLECKNKFKEKVIDAFINEYANARTPNPCIECNKYLKFGAMYNEAKKQGIEYIATGHYAKIEYNEKYKRYVLKKAKNLLKDQSYFLYSIPKELLSKIIFPLSDFENKDDIRKIAKKYNMEVASKPDSEDICFIPDGNYKEFLQNNSDIKSTEGEIVYVSGKVLGKHNGLYNYTIGQRKGLGLTHTKPLYVIGLDKENNRVIVGEEQETYKKDMLVNNINLLLFDEIKDKIIVSVKTRYSAKEEKATIKMVDDDLIKVEFENPVARITSGQSAVFYIGDIVLGGGKIV